jgi:hypothetical protein
VRVYQFRHIRAERQCSGGHLPFLDLPERARVRPAWVGVRDGTPA